MWAIKLEQACCELQIGSSWVGGRAGMCLAVWEANVQRATQGISAVAL